MYPRYYTKYLKYITPNISEVLHQYFRSITPHLKFITPYISGIAPNISEVFQEIFPFPPSLTVLSINIPERDILRPSRQQVGAMYTLYSKSLKEHYTTIDLIHIIAGRSHTFLRHHAIDENK